MRLQPGLQHAVRTDRPTALHRTTQIAGRPLAWRPPIRLVGLLELLFASRTRLA